MREKSRYQDDRTRRDRWKARFDSLEGRSLMTSAAFQVINDWNSGFTGQIQISNTNAAPVTNWRLEFDFDLSIDQIWNGVIESQTGSHYVVRGESWGLNIPGSGSVSFGFNASPGHVTPGVEPTGWKLNGQSLDTPPATLPEISINDVSVTEGDPNSGSETAVSGFFHTSGNQILDANNQPVRIAGVNWFGFETSTFAPHGLWARGYKDMMDQMKQQGFNTIRLPFSNELFDKASKPNGIDFAKNPDLQGLSGIEVMDKIVDYAGQIGLRIFLDHHRSTAGNSAQESGLWYTPEYSESRWISDWVMLANRYQGNPTVIGADLHNEPHGQATWGSGNPQTDWRMAAQKAGNAVIAANPDWLIIVEGIEFVGNDSYWWGGNLSAAGQYPVVLNEPGHLVYSVHDYPQSVYAQSWFSAPNYPENLPSVWDQHWGYLYKQNIAPVLLGEFGSKMATASDRLWADRMIAYLKGDSSVSGSLPVSNGQQGPSWTWWSWNPNSGDTGGILNDDWTTINTNKVALLEPIKFVMDAPSGGGVGTPNSAVFQVKLSAPSATPVTVSYSTMDSTALADSDYTAVSGSILFEPGQTTKTVLVPIKPDTLAEPSESFTVKLGTATGATISKPVGMGTIQDDDGQTSQPAPKLTIQDASIKPGSIGNSAMTFDVVLSAASTSPVSVNYTTVDATAKAPTDYLTTSGTLVFAPDVTKMTISVPVLGTTVVKPAMTFQVRLSNSIQADIANAIATGTILPVDPPVTPPPAPPAASAVQYSVRSHWDSGFVADVVLTNFDQTQWNGWTIEFELDSTITNIWGGQIVSHVGNHYVIKSLSYNSLINPGKTAAFGFQANTRPPTGGLRNIRLNGKSI